MNMTLITFLIIILSATFSCQTSCPIYENPERVDLIINTDSITYNHILTISIKIKNTTSKDVYVLNLPDFSTSKSALFRLVITKNGREKILSDLAKKTFPKKSDYIKVKSNQAISFDYKLDLHSLVYDFKDIGILDNDFGTYQIQILYFDRVQKHKKAINYLKSNRVEVTFLP